MQGPSSEAEDGSSAQDPTTMQCDTTADESGMIPRVLGYLFSRLEEDKASAAAEGAAFEFTCRRAHLNDDII